MPPRRIEPPRNRNGVVGDHAAYARVPRTMDDILREVASGRRRELEGRTSVEVSTHGGLALVRYRLGSDEHRGDLAAVGAGGRPSGALEGSPGVAVFGVVDRSRDVAVAVVDVMDEDEGRGLNVLDLFVDGTHRPDPDAMLAFLGLIDLPPSYHQGTGARIADLLDLWYDREAAAWERREPVHAVAVGFERICFCTVPEFRETVEVIVPVEPGQDMADADADAAYWARAHYRDRGWQAFSELPRGGRDGFSSWLGKGEPRLVKVVDDGFYAKVAAEQALIRADRDEASPSPG